MTEAARKELEARQTEWDKRLEKVEIDAEKESELEEKLAQSEKRWKDEIERTQVILKVHIFE